MIDSNVQQIVQKLRGAVQYDADPLRGQEVIERKSEPGHTRRHRTREEERGLAAEPFRGDQPVHDDESRPDPHQAQHYVHEGECRRTKAPYPCFLRTTLMDPLWLGSLRTHRRAAVLRVSRL